MTRLKSTASKTCSNQSSVKRKTRDGDASWQKYKKETNIQAKTKNEIKVAAGSGKHRGSLSSTER